MKTQITHLIFTAFLCVLMVALLYENRKAHVLLMQNAILQSEALLASGPCRQAPEREDKQEMLQDF